MGSWYDLGLIARSGTERQRCLSGAHQHEYLSLFEAPFFGVDLFIEIKQRGILAIGCLNSHYGGRLNLTAF